MIWYFLPIIVVLGIVISIEDYKKNKIRNNYLIVAGILGLLMYVFLIMIDRADISLGILAVLTSVFSLLIGAAIWYLGWWGAGDAKLYAIFVLLVPPTTYKYATTQFYGFEILINSLIPIAFFLLVHLLVKTDMKQKKKAAIHALNPKRLAFVVTAIFAITWGSTYLFQYIGIQTNIIFNILIVFVVLRILQKTLKEQTFAFLIFISIIRIFMNTRYYTTRGFLISFAILIALYIILLGFLRKLSDVYAPLVHLSQLKPGHILDEGVLKNGMKTKTSREKNEEYLIDKTQPLNEEDIRIINGLHKKGELHFNKIKVHETIPFAPFLFLGALISIICQGNCVLFMRAMFGI